MSNNAIPTYKFKPFQFKVLEKNHYPLPTNKWPGGHRLVCNNAYLFSYKDILAESQRSENNDDLITKEELWKYSFDLGEWKQIMSQNTPQNIMGFSLIGNTIIIHCSIKNDSGKFHMYYGNLTDEYKENEIQFKELKVSGDVPILIYDQGIVMNKTNFYLIGETYGPSEKNINVHSLDLNTRKWEVLHKSTGESQVPVLSFQHEVVFYKGRIYLMGGGKGYYTEVYYKFSKIYVFHVATGQWQFLITKHDDRIPGPGYPDERYGHSCVQCPEKSNLVYICGGHNSHQSFKDVWRLNLDNLQWEKITWCTMPQPISFHSTAVTPSGKMCCFGGVVSNEDFKWRIQCTNDIISVWITVPKLQEICWEAMLHYFRDQMFQSSDEHLKEIGIPPEFYKRIIEARHSVQ